MSLSNELIPNQYNTYSNSLTMNLNASQPVVGNNTLWIKTSNNHLYRDGVDLEGGAPLVSTDNILYFPAYTAMYADNIASNDWLMAKDSNGVVVLQLTSQGTPANLYMDPVSRQTIGGINGFKLTGLSIVYCNLTAMTSATVTLNSLQYTNNSVIVETAVPITGSINTAASATNLTPWVTNFPVTTPFYLVEGQTLDLKISINSPGGNQTNVYGVFAFYTNSF